MLATAGLEALSRIAQRVQSNYIVECRVSLVGIAVLIWGSMPHNSAWDPLGRNPAVSPPLGCRRTKVLV